MSDLDILGDAAGAFLPAAILVPIGVICVISLPFMMIDKCSESKDTDSVEMVETVQVEAITVEIDETTKKSMAERIGHGSRNVCKDFIKGFFSKE